VHAVLVRARRLRAGERPSLKDWETHLTTIFPEVRLKRYMEMRGADGGPASIICALPAFWVGLLYSRCAPGRGPVMPCQWRTRPAMLQACREALPRCGVDVPVR